MIREIQSSLDVLRGLDGLRSEVQAVVDEAVAICEIPAPTFHEARRAEYVARRIRELGLGDPAFDAEGDVLCELPGDPGRQTVVLMAHMDTVFGPDVPIKVRRNGHTLAAPGIGDNSMGVAAMLWLGHALQGLPDRGTLVLAANVGEEGLGNLRGAKAVWNRYGSRADTWIILEGAAYNRGVHTGVCSKRIEVTYTARGGHSWLNFGQPSAIHGLGRLIDQIAQIHVPRDPKTTYNVGIIRGGSTVNAIAAEASLVLDMRSEDPTALSRLDAVVTGLVGAVAEASLLQTTVDLLGERSGGRLASGHPLIALVEEAAASVGRPVRWESASTDANEPLSHRAAAVCLGAAKGEGAHSLDETLDVSFLPDGLRQTYLILAALLRAGRA